jgi:hypothetical protein
MLTWRIRTKVGGAFTDADALPTITITLVANGNIMYLDQTMSRDSLGTYSWVQPSSSPGIAYHGTWTASIAGVPVTDSYDQTEPGDAWYYSNRAGIASVLDADTIRVLWDMDDDGNEDPGAMLVDGITSDSDIDLFLATQGISNGTHAVSDLTTAKAFVVAQLAKASNLLTIYNGWIRRGLPESDFASRLHRSANGIAGVMSGYKPAAEEILERIADVLLGASNGAPAATGAMTVIVGNPRQYPGTGCVRPVTVDLNSGVGSL